MTGRPVLEERREEFFSEVWDHTADAFQAQFDERRPLTASEVASLQRLVCAIGKGETDRVLSGIIREEIQSSRDDLLSLLLQLVGSTRNKILTDLKAKKIKTPSDYRQLPNVSEAWVVAGPYIASRLRSVLGCIADGSTAGALEAVNQATYPGYIRQQRAKLQGHEAEARLAGVLLVCQIPFQPEEKAENPLCRDAQIVGVSFDLVIPSIAAPKVCFKATVHTSNIGQYGESKDALEAEEAKVKLERHYGAKRPLLVVLIDGVGFSSNAAGLNGVLTAADEFCQFATLWKAAVIGYQACGMTAVLRLSAESQRRHSSFLRRYSASVRLATSADEHNGRWVNAGDGQLLIQ
jgi:hypothetical protein